MTKKHMFLDYEIKSLGKKTATGDKWVAAKADGTAVAYGKTMKDCEKRVIDHLVEQRVAERMAQPQAGGDEKVRKALERIVSNLERNDAVTLMCIPQMIKLGREALAAE